MVTKNADIVINGQTGNKKQTGKLWPSSPSLTFRSLLMGEMLINVNAACVQFGLGSHIKQKQKISKKSAI